MNTKIKNCLAVFTLVLFISAISSCNRGLGCPNNFSVEASTQASFDLNEPLMIHPDQL